jgi:hypothetical protein
MNLDKHAAQCSICRNEKREAIEEEWVDWGNTDRIAAEYSVSRDAIYRHARAFKLFEKRRANVAKALERIIEHAGEVEVTAPAVVSAVQTLSKINALGRWIDRVETVSLGALFEKMTPIELDEYARTSADQRGRGPQDSDEPGRGQDRGGGRHTPADSSGEVRGDGGGEARLDPQAEDAGVVTVERHPGPSEGAPDAPGQDAVYTYRVGRRPMVEPFEVFSTRIAPSLRRRLEDQARASGVKINDVCIRAFELYLSRPRTTKPVERVTVARSTK